ncbi:MAG: M56 family metallopeptidase [Fimbriimonas sp.]
MNPFDALATHWTERLVDAALFGGLFVLAVWVFCLAFRRLPASLKAWLWWIASAQLVVRLFLSVPVVVPTAVSNIPVKNTFISFASSPEPIASQSAPLPQLPSAELLLAGAWFLGVTTGCCILAIRLIGARRLLARSYPLTEGPELECLQMLAQRVPRLLESPEVKCPLLVGLWKPAIVVPSGYAAKHVAAEMRMAFAHELAHLQRKDQWLTLAIATAQTLFFFHPLAWLATREAVIAREEACDLEALRLCGESPGAYAQFLLKSAQARTPVAALGAAYGYRNLRRRINMLKHTSTVPTYRRAWLLVVVAAAAAAIPWSVVAQTAAAPAQAPATRQISTAAAAPAIARTAAAPARATQAKPAKLKRTTKALKAAPPKLAPLARVPMPAARARDASLARTAPLAQAPARSFETARAVAPPSGATRAVDVAMPLPTGTVGQAVPAMMEGSPTRSAEAIYVPAPLDVRLVQNVSGDALQSLVSVNFNGANLHDALVKLLTEAGVNYVIKAKLEPERITCRVNALTTERVLQAILEGVDQPLTFRVEKDIVFIIAK